MNIKQFLIVGLASIFMASCGGGDSAKHEANEHMDHAKKEVKKVENQTSNASADPMKNKGIGPVKSITLGDIDQALADKGKQGFKDHGCKACHKIKKRYIGPALKGVTERRSPEWIMNMMLNPEEMVANDPIAKQLLAEYSAPMANQHLTEDQAREILEYFRTNK